MEQIRKGIFETNSSSIHSVCIPKKPKIEFPEKIVFKHTYFGYSSSANDHYKTLEEKASYLWEALLYLEDDYDRIGEDLVQKYIKDFLDRLGVKYEFVEDEDLIHGFDSRYGSDNFFEKVVKDEEKLKAFLFDPESVANVMTDHDFYDIEDSVGLVDRNKFEVILK